MTNIRQPKAVNWYGIYAALVALLHVVLIAVALIAASPDPGSAQQGSWGLHWIVLIVVAAPGLLLYGGSLFMPRSKWTYYLHIVLLALGVSSCMLPIALPVLVKYTSPEVKRWFKLNTARPDARHVSPR